MFDTADQTPTLAGRLSTWLHWLGVYGALPTLIGVVFVDVLLRFVFSQPLMWGNEVSSLVLLVVFFASLPHCTYVHGHVRMELLYRRLGRGGRRAADAVSNAAGLIFAAFLTYQSLISGIEAWGFGDGAEFIDLPYWPFLAVMSACGLFMGLIFAGRAWAALRGTGDDA